MHWLDKDAVKPPNHFYYKGLTFAKYHGNLSREERRSGDIFYAFFGGKPMHKRAIEYQVDKMIARGEWKYQAA